jgi:hypothetical protein
MKKLTFNSGEGYDFAPQKKGFTELKKEIKYCESLNEEKEFWDITQSSDLLACHSFED